MVAGMGMSLLSAFVVVFVMMVVLFRSLLFGILAIVVLLELSRRVAGLFIPIMTLAFLSYMTWLGPLVSGIFHFPGLTWETAYSSFADAFGAGASVHWVKAGVFNPEFHR